MKVYVASSWRNKHQPEVVARLKAEGFDVYDFRNPPGGAGFGWEQVLEGAIPARVGGNVIARAAEWRRMVDHPIARAGYAADIKGVRTANAIVLVLPAGRSASFEFGYAMGMQRGIDVTVNAELERRLSRLRAIVYCPEPTEPELMFREALITDNLDTVVQALRGDHGG